MYTFYIPLFIFKIKIKYYTYICKPGFLNLGTMGISYLIILCSGGMSHVL